MEQIYEHFQNEAEEFDVLIRKLIPRYDEMLDALVDALPFERTSIIGVLDLGAGTGAVAQRILEYFPNAHITCLDMSPNMLRIAKARLAANNSVSFELGSFEEFVTMQEYDAVVSSLALHHVVADRDKISFYRKLRSWLRPGGVFFNADVVLGSTAYSQALHIERGGFRPLRNARTLFSAP